MTIHPDGDGDGAGHISVFLAILGQVPYMLLGRNGEAVFEISRLNGVPQNVSLIKHSKIPLMVTLLTANVSLELMYMSSRTRE
ncbi:hypothetical protein H5410_019844 [Solanum commersonii]|uniref:Uncharacterized protein n=1 Tax=Solanum commersonii TaxID=4109 RepID=A0A9J5Z6E1_SOLCO|nr:hypothetical protein H5410_019844 [Solanum commersonii]